MDKAVKVFIVEGENRDLRFINSLTRVFFSDNEDSIIINIPSSGNIYMLYGILKADDFETDVVEVIRERIDEAQKKLQGISRKDVTEVYLIYDADLHHTDKEGRELITTDILQEMLLTFDNETENGKLYVSYPMIEAVYDVTRDDCSAFSKCWICVDDFSSYKTLAGASNPMASKHFNSKDEWKIILQAFHSRLCCLLNRGSISYSEYKNVISPKEIFDMQSNYINRDSKVFVLSALPEILLDYYREDFWKENIDENIMCKRVSGECSNYE